MSPGIRQRLLRGAQAQGFGHLVRVVIQLGSVPIFTGVWGLELYGEWLILASIPAYFAFSDIGFVTAAGNEMVMSAGRGDRARALAVFQAVTRAGAFLVVVFAALLALLATALPVAGLLNLSIIGESTAGSMVLLLGLDAILAMYAALLYGGFACEGRYGEGAFGIAAINLVEFAALGSAILLGGGPGIAAAAMFGARAIGTALMYVALRRRAPWLRFGNPGGVRRTLRPLLSPALASGAFPVGFALNLQGMVLLVGLTLGPASAAIFSTLRTLSRSVVQLLASVNAIISPELSKAFGAGDQDLIRRIHRRGCQVALWLAGILVVVLAVIGGPLVELWTGGKVGAEGSLLYLFLAIAAIDAFWYTSVAILIATNRHQRVAIDYLLGSLVALLAAALLLPGLDLPGAALALVGLELFMAVQVLRRALPAADDTLRGLLRAVRTPPFGALGTFLRVREGS